MRRSLTFVGGALILLAVVAGALRLVASTDTFTTPADRSPLSTPNSQATLVCDPPWPTPPALACPWLPSPTPGPSLAIPLPTPFEPPAPPVQSPTPLPLPPAVDSPEGMLLFTSFFAPGAAPEEPELLYVSIDEKGRAVGSITRWEAADDARVDLGRLSVSPDGHFLLSIYDTEGGEAAVVVDFIEKRRIGFISAGTVFGWHPNGREFIFGQETEGDPGLWLVEASTGEHRLLAQPAALSHASFSGAEISPDGQVLVFSLSGSGISQIWMANADGSEPFLVSDTSMAVFSWSPSAQDVLYSGEYRPDPEAGRSGTQPPPRLLWLLDRQGQRRRSLNLSWEPGIAFTANQQPAWSPTGRHVANSAQLDPSIPYWQEGTDPRSDRLYAFRNTGIWVENVETGEMWLAAEHALDPIWSPDGRMLAIARMDENEQVDIWLVGVSNRSLYRITDTPQVDRYPVWLRSSE